MEKEDLTEEETDEVVADLENPTRVEILINQIQEVLVQEIMEGDLDLEDQEQESQKVIQALEDQSLLMQIALQDPEEIEESNIYVKNELTL